MNLLESYRVAIIYGLLTVSLACLFHKYSNKMAENFLFSRYYDTVSDNDKHVIVYNLHLSIVQIVFAALIGLLKFHWQDYFFGFSILKIGIWILIGVVLNVKWLADWIMDIQFDRSASEKQFGLRFAAIAVAQVVTRAIGVHQPVSWIEWGSYAVLLVTSFFIHKLRFEHELQIVDIEPTRPSTISMNVKYNSIYIPSNN